MGRVWRATRRVSAIRPSEVRAGTRSITGTVCLNPSANVRSFSTIAGGGEWATNLSCPQGTYLVGIIFWNGDTVSPAPWYRWPWGVAYIPNHQLECRPYPTTG